MAASDLMVILKNHRAAPMETRVLPDPGKNLPGTSVMPVKTTNLKQNLHLYQFAGEPSLAKGSEVTNRKPRVLLILPEIPALKNSKPVKASTAAKPMTTDPSKS